MTRTLLHAAAWWGCAALILALVYVLGAGCATVRVTRLPAPEGVYRYQVDIRPGTEGMPGEGRP